MTFFHLIKNTATQPAEPAKLAGSLWSDIRKFSGHAGNCLPYQR